MLAGIIFDFDGVIVDSERLHFRAFARILGRMGKTLTWEEYLSRYIGFDDRDVFREFLGRTVDAEGILEELLRRKGAEFRRMVEEEGVQPYPGAVELVREAHAKCAAALCSGALRTDVEPILESLGIAGLFAAMVTAEDVQRSKPDPESYRLVVERLRCATGSGEIRRENLVVLEDTPAGVRAAREAGLAVIAVANTHSAAELVQADAVLDSLERIGVDDLAEIATGSDGTENTK